MIWQLMKRDLYWQAGVLNSIFISVVTVIAGIWMELPAHIPRWGTFRGDLAFFLSIETALFAIFCFAAYAERDLYEAALPLDGRDIWLSRLVAMLSTIWAPVPIAAAGGLPALMLLAGASVITVAILCRQCFRVRELGAPKWFGASLRAFVAAAVGLSIFVPLRSVHWPEMPPASGVFTVCGLASLLLFPFGWSRVPKSFSIAPLELGYDARSAVSEGPKIIPAPVFRSIYPVGTMLFLFGFVVCAMAYEDFGIAILAAIQMPTIFDNGRWLLALPFSRRKLFALVAAAPAAAVAVGSIAARLLHRGGARTPREYLIDFAIQLASVFFAMFLIELPWWRPLSALRTWIKWIPFALAFFSLPLLSLSGLSQEHFSNLLFFLLPVPTYWLAEKAFVEQEYHRPLIPTNQYRRF